MNAAASSPERFLLLLLIPVLWALWLCGQSGVEVHLVAAAHLQHLLLWH